MLILNIISKQVRKHKIQQNILIYLRKNEIIRVANVLSISKTSPGKTLESSFKFNTETYFYTLYSF